MGNFKAPHIPSNAPTRWNFNSRLLNIIAENIETFEDVFEFIINDSSFDSEAVREAVGFIHILRDFDFMFLLFSYQSIFHFTSYLWDILQLRCVDIQFCQNKILLTIENIEILRSTDNFQKNFSLTSDKARSLPQMRRKRKIDKDIPSIEAQYRILYFEVIDNILTQLRPRFADFSKLSFLNLVNIQEFPSFQKNFPQTLLD